MGFNSGLKELINNFYKTEFHGSAAETEKDTFSYKIFK
jgi:hypothetical protein